MLEIYATTAIILLASLVVGRAILALLDWPSPAHLSGAVGFAALVTVAPFVIRFPGRATTAAVVLGALTVAAAITIRRPIRAPSPIPLVVTGVVIAAASLPFLFQDHTGVLGEGIYTNDHAAQLYWAEWLQSGFGPEPSAVRFGYPIGPQALTVIAAEFTGADLISAFNGLLLAIPALTALAALAALGDLPPFRRGVVAALCALPYLAASFLAQSAFKETAMALFVLALAVALSALAAGRAGVRAVSVIVLLLAAGSVFTYSIPGLAWFALAIPAWLAVETLAGRRPVDLTRARTVLAEHRVAIGVGAVALAAVLAVAFDPAREFIERIDDVQASAGRLSSPVFPGEALGVWPQGDFRIVRGEVGGAIPAVALGALALAVGGWALLRRHEFAPLAVLATGGVVYVGARLFAEIHVEAKALAVIAPLTTLVMLRGLLTPEPRRGAGTSPRSRTIGPEVAGDVPAPRPTTRFALGAVAAIALAASTFLALRTAPIGFDERGAGLEALGERIDGDSVVFLGVDRFAGYRLRGTLARAPAGYVPEEIAARPEKVWQQGQAADFDTVEPAKLDKFDYAITTAAAHASAPPPNFGRVDEAGGYVLWERQGETPRSRVADGEDGEIGAPLDCAGAFGRRRGTATVITGGRWTGHRDWDLPSLVDDAAGGQERAFAAPGEASTTIPALEGDQLSLQYHSQAPLEVVVEGEVVAELPPILDGMYLDGAGRGAFWPAGEVTRPGSGKLAVTVRALEPDGFQDALGVEHRVWLGDLATTPADGGRATAPFREACDRYVDHFALRKGP